jgi:hypothetical protein
VVGSAAFRSGAGSPFWARISAKSKNAEADSVSRLPAGGRGASGRSPDAARVPVASRQRGRRTGRGKGFPLAPSAGVAQANLRSTLRPAPHSRRLMRAPLSEQGHRNIDYR